MRDVTLAIVLVAGLGGALALAACDGGPSSTDRTAAITEADSEPGFMEVVGLGHVESEMLCSGVLVSPRVVLTAAHCLDLEAPGLLRVFVGAGPDAFAVHESLDLHVHPGWDRVSAEHDIGLVMLAEPASAAPAVLSARSMSEVDVGAEVLLVGFGHASATDLSHERRSGTGAISAVAARRFAVAAAPSLPCPGDSGGPALRPRDGVLEVVGLVSFGSGDCQGDATYTRTDPYLTDFVSPYVAWSRPGSREVGEHCLYAAHCAEEQCMAAPDDPSVRYCTRDCLDGADCPSDMQCAADSGAAGRCVFAPPTPGAVGWPCLSGDQCASEQCTATPDGNGRVCSYRCFPAGEPCPAGYECVEDPGQPGRHACLPPTLDAPASCRITGPRDSPLMLAALLWLLFRGRVRADRAAR